MSNYSDMLGSVVSTPATKMASPVKNDQDLASQRLLEFEKQRLETAQRRLMSLRSDVCKVNDM